MANEFVIGNKEAEKWDKETVEAKLFEMLQKAVEDEDILCLQDAIHAVGLYRSSLDYLIDKFPVFGNIKKDIQDVIISRINKGTLTNNFNATAGIWRMKQCGEKDVVDHNNNTTINWNESKSYEAE